MSDGNVHNGRWQFITAMAAVAIATIGGAIWLGQITNQIGVNTIRVDRLDHFADEVRDHNSNTTATFRDIDRRLNHLENSFNPGRSEQRFSPNGDRRSPP